MIFFLDPGAIISIILARLKTLMNSHTTYMNNESYLFPLCQCMWLHDIFEAVELCFSTIALYMYA